jgi:hypothetical protein
MHIRPQDPAHDITPGPPDYQISRDLGGPKPTMHIRPKDADSYVTPGPGAYSPTDANKPTAAVYTLKSRHESVERPNTAPYRDIGSTVGEGPKISLSSRHKVPDGDNFPGPNYWPPALGEDAQKSAMSFRYGQDRSPYRDNPGPGAYNIEPKFANEANKYTLHQRTNQGDPDNCSPGPAAYTPDINAQKPRAPSASMHIRPEDKGPDETPGYFDLGSTLGGPYWTIKRREPLELVPV